MYWRTSQEVHKHYALVDRLLFGEQEACYLSNRNNKNPIKHNCILTHDIQCLLIIHSNDDDQSQCDTFENNRRRQQRTIYSRASCNPTVSLNLRDIISIYPWYDCHSLPSVSTDCQEHRCHQESNELKLTNVPNPTLITSREHRSIFCLRLP
jgi:hypothetical protein